MILELLASLKAPGIQIASALLPLMQLSPVHVNNQVDWNEGRIKTDHSKFRRDLSLSSRANCGPNSYNITIESLYKHAYQIRQVSIDQNTLSTNELQALSAAVPVDYFIIGVGIIDCSSSGPAQATGRLTLIDKTPQQNRKFFDFTFSTVDGHVKVDPN